MQPCVRVLNGGEVEVIEDLLRIYCNFTVYDVWNCDNKRCKTKLWV